MPVTFDPVTRVISASAGVRSLPVLRDLYSEAKRQWLDDPILRRLAFPFRIFGGDPLTDTLNAGAFVFLQNQDGWRIRPDEADHELVIEGNLYAESLTDPMFVPTLGAFTVSIFLERSSLTQTVQVSGGGGGIVDPDAVWQYSLEGGMTAEEIMRVMFAVLAGKSRITPLAPGEAEVAFRDVADLKDRLVAAMEGSERKAVTLDPS
jgi:hypothetical protein